MDHPPVERMFPDRPRDRLIILAICAAHIAATWGRPSAFFGDYGSWLHAVDRFASGEIPYVDFYWQFPPLGLWIVGLPAGIFGASLTVVWTVTSAVFIAIVFVFARYVRLAVPAELRMPTFLVGILFALAYAPMLSAPLPLGMYTPAAPAAGLSVLVTTIGALQWWREGRVRDGLLLGVGAALCVLSKHDVWLPAFYLLVVGTFLGARRPGRASWLLPGLACTVTLAAAAVILGLSIGWEHLPRTVWTPGVMTVSGGQRRFAWERLTIQVGMSAGLVFAVAGSVYVADRSRRRAGAVALIAFAAGLAAAAIHVAASVYSASRFATAPPGTIPTEAQAMVTSAGYELVPMVKRALLFLRGRALWHLVPAMLPLLVGSATLWLRDRIPVRTRHLILFLVGLALAARWRRGFEHVDWLHLLIETPLYVLFIASFVPLRPAKRAGRLIFVTMCAAGAFAYWWFSDSPLMRGSESGAVAIETARGTIRASRTSAEWFRWLRRTLEERDPGGRVPLLVFGQTGGLAYWLGRENPTPWLYGSGLSFWSADEIIGPLLPPRRELFFLDTTIFDGALRLRNALALDRWDLPREPTRWTADRPLFEPFTRECEVVDETGNPARPLMTLYFCGRDR